MDVRDWTADLIESDRLMAELQTILSPEVLAPLPPSMQMTNGGVRDWISALERQAQCLVIRREEQMIGLLILADTGDAEIPTLHIGYLLGEAEWGQGFTSELVRGLIEVVSLRRPIRLVACVARDNPASARVLLKAGFASDPGLSSEETEMFQRRIG